MLLTISLGSATLEDEDPNRLTVATSTYFIHPDYDPSTLNNDIGIIEFRIPITLTSTYFLHYFNCNHFLNVFRLYPTVWSSANRKYYHGHSILCYWMGSIRR